MCTKFVLRSPEELNDGEMGGNITIFPPEELTVVDLDKERGNANITVKEQSAEGAPRKVPEATAVSQRRLQKEMISNWELKKGLSYQGVGRGDWKKEA